MKLLNIVMIKGGYQLTEVLSKIIIIMMMVTRMELQMMTQYFLGLVKKVWWFLFSLHKENAVERGTSGGNKIRDYSKLFKLQFLSIGKKKKKSSPKKVDFSGEYLLLVKDEVYNQTKNVD